MKKNKKIYYLTISFLFLGVISLIVINNLNNVEVDYKNQVSEYEKFLIKNRKINFYSTVKYKNRYKVSNYKINNTGILSIYKIELDNQEKLENIININNNSFIQFSSFETYGGIFRTSGNVKKVKKINLLCYSNYIDTVKLDSNIIYLNLYTKQIALEYDNGPVDLCYIPEDYQKIEIAFLKDLDFLFIFFLYQINTNIMHDDIILDKYIDF